MDSTIFSSFSPVLSFSNFSKANIQAKEEAYNIESLSSWRKQFLASNLANDKELKTDLLALPDDSRFTTCMAPCDEEPLIAIGSGSYETNMFFVQKNLVNQEEPLKVKAFFASKFPIYSLSYKSNLLITGTERSAAVLYQVSNSQLLSSSSGNEDSSPLIRCVATFKNKAVKSIENVASGKHIPSRRVKIVSFAPGFEPSKQSSIASCESPDDAIWPPQSTSASSSIFLSCLGGTINIWDVNDHNQPLRIEKMCSQPLLCADWSPHSPFSLIAGGSSDGWINVLDLRKRGKGLSWRAQLNDQKLKINDLSWSPFVPYWMATGGDEGVVNIWDLRFTTDNAPAVEIGADSIYGSVTKVCWSRNRVDLLCSGCSDRHVRLHSLRTEKTADDHLSFKSKMISDSIGAEDIGSIIGLDADLSETETYYSLSSCGDLYSHTVSNDLLYNVAPHRLSNEEYPREHLCESEVYTRNFSASSKGVLEFVDSLLTTKDSINSAIQSSQQIRLLCDLYKAKSQIQSSSWSFPATVYQDVGASETRGSLQIDKDKMVKSFISKFDELHYGLPPGFSLEGLVCQEPKIMHALEKLNMINLRIRFNSMLEEFRAIEANSDSEEKRDQIAIRFKNRETQLAQYLPVNPKLFDADLLKDIAKIILSHDCLRGLSFGKKMFEIYLNLQKNNQVSCDSLFGLVHVLLMPTIFDPEQGDPKKAQSQGMDLDVRQIRMRIRAFLICSPRVVLEMIKLEIVVQEIVLKGGDQVKVAEKIISAMNTQAVEIQAIIAKLEKPDHRLIKEACGAAADELITLLPLFNEIRPLYPSTITLSGAATRLYLNALIQMRSYDEYLANVRLWIAPSNSSLSNYPLSSVLTKQCYEVVIPRFKRQLDVVVSTINREPLSLEPRIYRDVIMKVANTIIKCNLTDSHNANSTLGLQSDAPSAFINILTPKTMNTYFETILRSFIAVLEALARHNAESKIRASKEAAPLVGSLENLPNSKKHPLVISYLDKIRSFIIEP
ncbi:hypothetical protein BB561_000854 [Smittium simulii]|uniref:Uncharacterized protein n=1 Tax=Smittium simulii TaxID=133385 RepID=A0A2T9YX72_9FUNG|nr:hypothetical protein BB561_000854 [Smittium simulii]